MTNKEYSEVELTKAILKMQSVVGRDRSCQILTWALALDSSNAIFNNEATLFFLIEAENFELFEELKDAFRVGLEYYPRPLFYSLLYDWVVKISLSTE